jgi:hypothetical protein
MNNLQSLTNSELANEMFALTKRFGELSLWIAEADLKVYTMITENKQVQSAIATEIDLKHNADLERYIVLSNLKKIELEIDKRVNGESNDTKGV